MHFSYKSLLLLISIVFENGFGVLYEGDLCTTSTGANGICKLISSCPSVLESLGTQILPTNCGFQNNTPIVCCVDASTPSVTVDSTPTRTIITTSTTTSTSKPEITPPTITQKVNLQVGDKSKQKCEEYAKYAYAPSPVLPLPGQQTLPPDLICALIEVENIVGGTPAKSKEFPHMALVGFDDDDNKIIWACGGSLISEKFVLSAAHCISRGKNRSAKYILLGELVLDTNTDDAHPQQISIKNTIRHPEYKSSSKYHDIVLFEMEHDAVLNSYTRPGCLNTNPILTNRLAVASGWGVTERDGAIMSKSLQKVTLDMFTNTECNYTYRNNINEQLLHGVEETQLCAGTRSGSNDTCQGDSGGPLQVINHEVTCTYKIIGVTSFGKICAVETIPAIYTRVSAYIQWIEDVVWP